MTLTLWLSLVLVCCIGAISPGPSLAVVLKHTLSNGRNHGIVTAISHGLGVAVWALLTIQGLAVLVTKLPTLYTLITWTGAGYLAWLGVKALRSKGKQNNYRLNTGQVLLTDAARDGAMIALLNPKLAVFFIALFSQFVSSLLTLADQLIMVATVACIDSLWYVLVSLVFSHSRILERLQRQSQTIDRISGVVLVALALRIVTL